MLELAIGKAATFRAWRAWQLRGTAGADAALQALPCLLPVSDADFASFEAYVSLRAPGGAGDPGLADPDAAFSASHSSRGFARTRLLVKSLRAHARAVAAELQAAVTWQAATEAVLSRPGAFAEVGPHYGGQALCCIYHGLIGGDEPGGPFRARLLQQLDPASPYSMVNPNGGLARKLQIASQMFFEAGSIPAALTTDEIMNALDPGYIRRYVESGGK